MHTCSPCLSSVGKKFLVALTGFFMLLFVVVHLMGNLEIFAGPEATNRYGAMLREFPKALWAFRIALIVAVITHIYLTISLSRQNQKARPEAYSLKRSRKASLSSRTMMLSGLTVLTFIAYHLAHFTLGITNAEYDLLVDSQGRHHVYNMVIMGFSNPLVSGFYIIAQTLLAFHLSHGIASAARTLGLSDPRCLRITKNAGMSFAALIALLFISIPVAVLMGLLPLDM